MIFNAIDKSDSIVFTENLLSETSIQILNKKEVEDKIVIGISDAYMSENGKKAILFVSRGYLHENRGGHRGGWEEIDIFEKDDKWVLGQSIKYVDY